MNDVRELNRPRKIRERLVQLEQIKESLSRERARFIGRCNHAFTDPPLTIQFAPRRELVWRRRVAVTGGPQSTVEFHTSAGRELLATLPPHMLSRYLELEEERILLNMQSKIVQSEMQHLRHYLKKHENARALSGGTGA